MKYVYAKTESGYVVLEQLYYNYGFKNTYEDIDDLEFRTDKHLLHLAKTRYADVLGILDLPEGTTDVMVDFNVYYGDDEDCVEGYREPYDEIIYVYDGIIFSSVQMGEEIKNSAEVAKSRKEFRKKREAIAKKLDSFLTEEFTHEQNDRS